MAEITEVENWIINKVIPSISKSGKLKNYSNESSENFKLINISINSIGVDEAFMLTKCYRLIFDYTYGRDVHTCSLIVKKTPTDIPARNYDAVAFRELFHNEILAYEQIIPTLKALNKTNELDCNFPTYYFSSEEKYDSSIVLGDFKDDGFQMSKSRMNLSLQHILLGAQQIGYFHGLGYVLKTMDKGKFDSLISQIEESRYETRLESFHMVANAGVTRYSNAVKKFYQQCPADFLQKLKKLMANNYEYSKKRLEPIEPFANLCHGDCVRNNMAFAYEDKENADIPKNAMLFDFQTLRYSSPMMDLTVFLSLSAGKDVRETNFDAIFDMYHQKLTSIYLTYTKKELPDFLTKTQLLKEYVRYLPFSLGIASFFLRHMHAPVDVRTEDLLGDEYSEMDIVLIQGGDSVDAELAALVKELYELSIKYDVDIFEGF